MTQAAETLVSSRTGHQSQRSKTSWRESSLQNEKYISFLWLIGGRAPSRRRSTGWRYQLKMWRWGKQNESGCSAVEDHACPLMSLQHGEIQSLLTTSCFMLLHLCFESAPHMQVYYITFLWSLSQSWMTLNLSLGRWAGEAPVSVMLRL